MTEDAKVMGVATLQSERGQNLNFAIPVQIVNAALAGIVRSTITPPNATHPRGTHHIDHFIVTPVTKFFVNGNKGSFADVKNGVHVNVKSHSGVDADRVDIVP